MKHRILQVGCGGISNSWLKIFANRKNIEIVGLVDINKNAAYNKKNEYNLECEIFDNLNTAIKATIPDIVIDNTIPEAHRNVVITALESGCHVFGEKPLADTFENAAEMVKKANDTQKSYFVVQNRRYLKHIRAYKNIIESGAIGDLGYLTANFHLGPHFGGFRDAMDSPLILDMSIHTFDQARLISGSDPISVYCHEFNPPGSWYNGSASACCIFEMTGNMVFSYNGSWCAVGNETSWQSEWRAMGSLGTAIWDGENSPFYEKAIKKEGDNSRREFERITPEYEYNSEEGHAGCINDMLRAVEENREAETDCKDNIKSFAMVMAAIKSSKEGRKVYMREIC